MTAELRQQLINGLVNAGSVEQLINRLIPILDGTGGLPYKVYTAVLTQSGTDDPVVTVKQNTFTDTVSVTRGTEGVYYITCSEFEGADPNFFKAVISPIATNQVMKRYQIRYPSPTSFEISTYADFSLSPGFPQDNLLNETLVEIRVYP